MKLRHYDHDGRARFITFSTHQRRPILTEDYISRIVIASIFNVCRIRQLRLLSYVIMPEHVHLVIIPQLSVKVGAMIGEMKSRSSKRVHNLLVQRRSRLISQPTTANNGVRRFRLWLRRCYDRNCRTEAEVWEKVNYCHDNRVRRGLVNNPEDWMWSSYSYYRYSDNLLVDIDVSSSG
jgi:putative transposase